MKICQSLRISNELFLSGIRAFPFKMQYTLVATRAVDFLMLLLKCLAIMREAADSVTELLCCSISHVAIFTADPHTEWTKEQNLEVF